MSKILDEIGIRIRTIRKHKGMTQDQLAEKAGLQDSYIGGVERGERNISLITLEKIINGLEITPSSLFQLNAFDFEDESNKKKVLNNLSYQLQSMDIEQVILIHKIINNLCEYNIKNK
jgi:transcriptional regulator with XRE-family HTH domain